MSIKGLDHFIKSISINPNYIKDINLSDNKITGTFDVDLLMSYVPQVQHIALEGNNIQQLYASQNYPSVRTLTFSKESLIDQSIPSNIINIFPNLGTLFLIERNVSKTYIYQNEKWIEKKYIHQDVMW